jgi:hypothetical protein
MATAKISATLRRKQDPVIYALEILIEADSLLKVLRNRYATCELRLRISSRSVEDSDIEARKLSFTNETEVQRFLWRLCSIAILLQRFYEDEFQDYPELYCPLNQTFNKLCELIKESLKGIRFEDGAMSAEASAVGHVAHFAVNAKVYDSHDIPTSLCEILKMVLRSIGNDSLTTWREQEPPTRYD